MSRLQELEQSLAGGTTATVAVIQHGLLQVANVGDTRALLISREPDGQYAFDQVIEAAIECIVFVPLWYHHHAVSI